MRAGERDRSLKDSRFEQLPKDLQKETILKIRRRKGMKEDVFKE